MARHRYYHESKRWRTSHAKWLRALDDDGLVATYGRAVKDHTVWGVSGTSYWSEMQMAKTELLRRLSRSEAGRKGEDLIRELPRKASPNSTREAPRRTTKRKPPTRRRGQP